MKPLTIAGNWKMNGGPEDAAALLEGIRQRLPESDLRTQVILFPPFVSIWLARKMMQGSGVHVGAQNLHHEENGAFTGEISARMLRESGCTYVIAGHSERRELFQESDLAVARKAKSAIGSGLRVIVCVGEKLEDRRSGIEESVVARQLDAIVETVDEKETDLLLIAYEPVWAIGTGETASPMQAQDMHAFIRGYLEKVYSQRAAASIPLLYGGSMKPENAGELLSQTDVDGGLIGGASLKAESFMRIVETAEQQER